MNVKETTESYSAQLAFSGQDPIRARTEFLNKPNQCFGSRRQFSSFYLRELPLADFQIRGEIVLEHIAAKLTDS
jgi:hypothetical protein